MHEHSTLIVQLHFQKQKISSGTSYNLMLTICNLNNNPLFMRICLARCKVRIDHTAVMFRGDNLYQVLAE